MALKPHCFLKTVALTTTREQLTTNNISVPAVLLQAELSNTGYMYVGDSTVSSTNYGVCLSAGDVYTLSAEELGWGKAFISMKDVWLVPSVNTDGVSCMYLERG